MVNGQDKKEQIRSFLAEILEVELSDIKDDTLLNEELGADSMMALEIMVNVEKLFGVTLNPEDFPKMKKLTDIVKIIETY